MRRSYTCADREKFSRGGGVQCIFVIINQIYLLEQKKGIFCINFELKKITSFKYVQKII